jgi:hypothetical protein
VSFAFRHFTGLLRPLAFSTPHLRGNLGVTASLSMLRPKEASHLRKQVAARRFLPANQPFTRLAPSTCSRRRTRQHSVQVPPRFDIRYRPEIRFHSTVAPSNPFSVLYYAYPVNAPTGQSSYGPMAMAAAEPSTVNILTEGLLHHRPQRLGTARALARARPAARPDHWQCVRDQESNLALH